MIAATLCLLLAAPGDLARARLVSPKPKSYVYKRVGACAIKADVYRLPGKQLRPAVMLIHGGALIFSSRESVNPNQVDRYLRDGCAVVSVDYRLAPETKLPAIVEDIKDAYRWMRSKGPKLFHIDPARIAVVGDSAGGYLALMSGFCFEPPPKAVVSFYGYGDIRDLDKPASQYAPPVERAHAYSVVGTKTLSESPLFPRAEFYNYCRQKGIWLREVVGLDKIKDRKRLLAFIPVEHITARYPPTLLLHGDRDSDVPISESQKMAAQLERFHVPNRLITMKGYDHLFDVFPDGFPPKGPPSELKDSKVISALNEAAAFVKRYLTSVPKQSRAVWTGERLHGIPIRVTSSNECARSSSYPLHHRTDAPKK